MYIYILFYLYIYISIYVYIYIAASYAAYSTVNLLAYDTSSRLARHELLFARPPGNKTTERRSLDLNESLSNRDLRILGAVRLVKPSPSNRLQE